MSNQIFKKNVPNKLLFDLLEEVCLKTDKYYLIDMNAYKKLVFHELQHDFCKSLKEYYHTGKQFYLDRAFTYKSFTNIIRQICKSSSIMYTSEMKYNESKYNIVFYIYF
jgi:hypothetical protein